MLGLWISQLIWKRVVVAVKKIRLKAAVVSKIPPFLGVADP